MGRSANTDAVSKRKFTNLFCVRQISPDPIEIVNLLVRILVSQNFSIETTKVLRLPLHKLVARYQRIHLLTQRLASVFVSQGIPQRIR